MKVISILMAAFLFWDVPMWLQAQSVRSIKWIWPDSLKGQQVNVKCLLVKNGVIYAGTSHIYLMVSHDSGLTWSQRGPAQGLYGDWGTVWTLAKTKTGDLLAGTDDGLFRSTNGGESWFLNSFSKEVMTLLVTNDGTIFAGGGDIGIQRSRDNGRTWREVLNGDSAIPTSSISAMVETASGVLLAGTFAAFYDKSAGIFRSTDGGDSWMLSNTGLDGWAKIIEGLAAYPYGVHTQRVYATTYLGGAFLSDDDGLSWQPITGIPELRGRAAGVLPPLGVFLGFATSQRPPLYYSSDSGGSWQTIPELRGYMVLSLARYSANQILVGTHDGVWLLTFGDPTFVESPESPEIPTSLQLHQNYPNPFNPSTTISFSIPNSELVTLKVFDVLGREVATLVNENLSAGNHSYNFDASNLTSGVYLYKLQAGKYTETKKMILMK